MKESIGGLSLFNIIIILLFVFIGIMCLTINYSKAFGVKDEVINVIESNALSTNGKYLAKNTLKDIVKSLDEVGYRETGTCPVGNYTGYDRNGNQNNTKAAFCIKTVDVPSVFYQDAANKCSGGKCSTISGSKESYPNMVYYEVVLFYKLDVPIIKMLMNFHVTGETKIMYGSR